MTALEVESQKRNKEVVADTIVQTEMLGRVYGDTLSKETKLFRYDVLHALMVGGIPRSKLYDPSGELKDILEAG